jgi:hypothetical protein
MFLSVVSKAAVDGKIGLFVCANREKFKRGPKKGELRWVLENVDGPYYGKLLKRKVIPAIQQKVGHLDHVIFQQDSATPQKTEHNKNILKEAQHPKITNRYQPPNSPDTNPNDLEILKTVADRVEAYDPQDENSLIKCVRKVWNGLSRRTIVNTINRTNKVFELIIQHRGGNRFRDF